MHRFTKHAIGAIIAVGCFLALSAFLILPNFVSASVPQIIGYQGRLEDASGNLLGGSAGQNYNFRFSIWDSLSGGSELWPSGTPTTTTLTVTNGLLSVGLGNTSLGFSPLDLDFNSADPNYLQVAIYNSTSSAWETLAPRQSVDSVGSAFNSSKLNGLTNGTSSNDLLALDGNGNVDLPGALSVSATSTFSGGVQIPHVTSSLLATDAAGNIVATTTAGGGGSGSSSGNNLVQVSNGSGGFIANASIKEDTTNGYLGNMNTGNLTTPLDIDWTGLTRSTSSNALVTFNNSYSATPSNPADIHEINADLYLSSTSSFVGTGLTDAIFYSSLTDTRSPNSTSTIGHQLGNVGYENADGGPNLTCALCASFYASANFDGTGETVTHLDAYNAQGFMNGTGTVTNWAGYNASMPSVASGTDPSLDYVTGFAASDPESVHHGTGSGCVAGVAVGSGICTTSGGAFAYFSDSTASSAFLGGLSVGKDTAPSDELDVNGSIQIGSDNGANSPIDLISLSTGIASVHIHQPTGAGRDLKWPADSATLVGTVGNNDQSGTVTGNLAAQTLFSFGDYQNRFFRITVYGVCTTSVASSTVTIEALYGDEQQAQTASSTPQSCAAAGNILSYTASFYADPSVSAYVRYATVTANSPQYKIHAALEELGPDSFNSN